MKPDAILTADWHIREDTPCCRKDDYEQAQWDKIEFIKELAEEHKCPIFNSGDLLHRWKASPRLLFETLKRIPNEHYCIAGNHDLPQHNFELINRSGLGVLYECGWLPFVCENTTTKLDGIQLHYFPWNIPFKPAPEDGWIHVAIVHHMVYQGRRKPWPGCTSPSGKGLVSQLEGYDLIVSGDNHQAFTEKHGHTLLVNPGSMMRMTAAQIDHKPRVYLWYADENIVEPVYLPINEDAVVISHIEKALDVDARMDAFVAQLKDDFELTLSFEKNVEIFMQQNETPKPVQDEVWAAVQGE